MEPIRRIQQQNLSLLSSREVLQSHAKYVSYLFHLARHVGVDQREVMANPESRDSPKVLSQGNLWFEDRMLVVDRQWIHVY